MLFKQYNFDVNFALIAKYKPAGNRNLRLLVFQLCVSQISWLVTKQFRMSCRVHMYKREIAGTMSVDASTPPVSNLRPFTVCFYDRLAWRCHSPKAPWRTLSSLQCLRVYWEHSTKSCKQNLDFPVVAYGH